MAVKIQQIAPSEIEAESFRIIAEEIGPTDFDHKTFKIVQRVIHATGDFSFARNLCFHPHAIEAGLSALHAGKNILMDVNMGAAGISQGLLASWGGRVTCMISDPTIGIIAEKMKKTRSEVAIEKGLDDNIGIVAVGNAPTALLRVMQLIKTMDEKKPPDLVIGVPVGFVNAAESKALLCEKQYPYISSKGRKGGSPVAAAIVNGLIRLAGEQ